MMDDNSIPTTPSDQLELKTVFWMQGKKNIGRHLIFLNFLVCGFWERKKMPSFDWGALGIGFPKSTLARQMWLVWGKWLHCSIPYGKTEGSEHHIITK